MKTIRYFLGTLGVLLIVIACRNITPQEIVGGVAVGGGREDYHFIFVSSVKFDGNLGGMAGADLKCRVLMKGRNFRAVLNSDKSFAIDRLEIRGPVYNMAGELVANNSTEFWGRHSNFINYDELGQLVTTPNEKVMTGSMKGMQYSIGPTGNFTHLKSDCEDWTSKTFDVPVHTGTINMSLVGMDWVTDTLMPHVSCNTGARIYCISQ